LKIENHGLKCCQYDLLSENKLYGIFSAFVASLEGILKRLAMDLRAIRAAMGRTPLAQMDST
jgi:hypothetical protein